MNIHAYLNFELLIEPTTINSPNDAYRTRILDSPTGQGRCDFVLPFTEAELQTFLNVSGRATRGLRLASSPPEDAPQLTPQTFGQRLFDAAFAGDVGIGLIRSLDEAARQTKGLRIQLRLDSPELADLPWEFLYATPLDRFLLLSNQTVLVRYLELAQGEKPLQVSPPLRILAVISDPTDVAKLNVEAEWTRMNDALLPLQGNGLLTLERLEEATLAALQSRLQQDPPVHILHFIGHGYFDLSADPSQGGAGGLIFEDQDRRSHRVEAAHLATTLHDHKNLRLLFLNACEGARGGRVDNFAGTAQKLVQQGIPAVLAMQFEVTDRAAIQIAHEFYRTTVNAYPADAALAEARKAVSTSGNPREWATPVLFSRSDDNQVLVMPQGDALPVIDIQPFEPETVLIRGGPFHMGSDSDAPEEAPQHEVTLPDFRMGKFPVTNAEYAEFVRQTSHAAPRGTGWFLGAPPEGKEDHPVTAISWYDARAYGEWLGGQTKRRYRLPSEAEWELAARGSERPARRFPWEPLSNQEISSKIAYNRKELRKDWSQSCVHIGCGTDAVDARPEGASPFGCLDMLGNVQEWTLTIWGSAENVNDFPYPQTAPDGPANDAEAVNYPTRVYRIHRGGSYRSTPDELRISARGRSLQESKVSWRGFRILMEIP